MWIKKVTIGKLGFFRGGMAQLVRLWIKKKTVLGVVPPHQAIILPDNTYLHPQIKEYL